jgi:hypothetical protein
MIRPLASSLFLTLIANSILAAVASEATADPLATLRAEHPRLLASANDWAVLKERVTRDPALASYHNGIIATARALLDEAPAERKMTGRRLLHVSRLLVHRIATLGYAWRTTGDPVFARRAEAEMLAAATFSDWNPSHFLDVAEATAALAIGYDWCFDALSSESRSRIRAAIVELGLKPGLEPNASHNGWHRSRNNWNQVCFGGLSLGALAIAEDEPGLAAKILVVARAGIGHGLAPYAPDGVYPEGPSYWS